MLSRIQDILSANQKNKKVLSKQNEFFFKDEQFKDLYWGLDPFLKDYFFEANPSYYYQYANAFDLGRYPIVMFRDGFLGLLDFFMTYPKPISDIKTLILVPKTFATLVPKAWSAQVACYEVLPRSKVSAPSGSDLVCFGHGVEELYWKKSADDLFKEIEQYSKSFDKISCFFPTRSSMLSLPKDQFSHFHTDLFKSAVSRLGEKVEFYEDLSSFQASNETSVERYFFNVDSTKVLNCDGHMEHLFYTRGYQNLTFAEKTLPITKNGLSYNLSLHHKINISEIDISKSVFSDFFIHYATTGKRLNNIYRIFQDSDFRDLFNKYF